jgi:hypothetical protein
VTISRGPILTWDDLVALEYGRPFIYFDGLFFGCHWCLIYGLKVEPIWGEDRESVWMDAWEIEARGMHGGIQIPARLEISRDKVEGRHCAIYEIKMEDL